MFHSRSYSSKSQTWCSSSWPDAAVSNQTQTRSSFWASGQTQIQIWADADLRQLKLRRNTLFTGIWWTYLWSFTDVTHHISPHHPDHFPLIQSSQIQPIHTIMFYFILLSYSCGLKCSGFHFNGLIKFIIVNQKRCLINLIDKTLTFW